MSTKNVEDKLPMQLEFKPLKEEFGEYRLEDGSIIKARLVLADVFMIGEDPIGPELAYSIAVAMRFIVPEEIRKRVKDKPLATHVDPRDPGWRRVRIVESKPAYSEYILENGWLLKLRLEIVGVAKNENYRTQMVTPHYVARWTAVGSVERLQKEGGKVQS